MRKGKEMNQSKTTRERMGRWGGRRGRGEGGEMKMNQWKGTGSGMNRRKTRRNGRKEEEREKG